MLDPGTEITWRRDKHDRGRFFWTGKVEDVWHDERGQYVSVDFGNRGVTVFGSRSDFAEGPFIDELEVDGVNPTDIEGLTYRQVR